MVLVILIIIFLITLFVITMIMINVFGRKKLERALNLMRNGKYESALAILKELYAKNPNVKLYNWYMAQCYENLGDLEMAVVEYGKVALSTELPPPLSLIKAHEKLGVLNLKLGNLLKAKHEFETVLSINPAHALAHYYLGEIYFKESNYQKAGEHFEKAITYDDSLTDAYLKLGKINYFMNHNDKAKRYFVKAIEIDRNLHEAHFYYALVLEKDRVYDKSIVEFNKALEEERFRFDCYAHLGSIYRELGNSEEAVKNYESALELGTDDLKKLLEVKYEFADYLIHVGNLKRALELWEEIYKVQPNFKDVAHKLEVYGEISKSTSLTRFITSSREEFAKIGSLLCRLIGVSVERYVFIKDDLLEFYGKMRVGKDELNVIVDIAKWTIQVGELPVRELLEKLSDEGANRAIFITSSDFTEKAYDLSRIRPIELIPKKELEPLLERVFKKL